MQRFAIIGFPLSHSLSPQIHNRAFTDLGLAAGYEKIEIQPDRLAVVLERLRKENWRGFNVTIPFKEQVLSLLDGVDERAARIGAVNTILCADDGWQGFNTDWMGFLKPLQQQAGQIRRCLLIGAGGAARAVFFALGRLPKVESVTVVNRTVARAERLCTDLQPRPGIRVHITTPERLKPGSGPFDLLVNCTSLGLHGELCLDPRPFCHPASVVYDLIYNPVQTPFLQLAGQVGCPTLNGWPMLVFQAEEACRIWTGHRYPQKTLDYLLNSFSP